MSALCHKRTSPTSFDDLVGDRHDARWNGEAKRPSLSKEVERCKRATEPASRMRVKRPLYPPLPMSIPDLDIAYA
jgi:hypothetical protein